MNLSRFNEFHENLWILWNAWPHTASVWKLLDYNLWSYFWVGFFSPTECCMTLHHRLSLWSLQRVLLNCHKSPKPFLVVILSTRPVHCNSLKLWPELHFVTRLQTWPSLFVPDLKMWLIPLIYSGASVSTMIPLIYSGASVSTIVNLTLNTLHNIYTSKSVVVAHI